MQLSEGVEWGAHCAVVLAMLPDGAALPAGRLAEYHGVPGPYLAKSLQALMRAGIVASSPGRRGGYRLARPASAISLLDVVDAIEGERAFFRCTEIRRRGPAAVAGRANSPACHIAAAMWRAEERWREELAAVNVEEIARVVAEGVPPVARAKAEAWLSEVLASRG